MFNESNTLSPAKIELISNVSGAYSAPFWDGLREVTGTLDTVRKIRFTNKGQLYPFSGSVRRCLPVPPLHTPLPLKTICTT